MIKPYTISAFTENTVGLLNRITIILARRRVNIESLTVSETERHGVSRFTILVKTDADKIEKIVKQIRKIIEVLAAFSYDNSELVFNEMAMYKIVAEGEENQNEIEQIAIAHKSKVVYKAKKFMVLEKTGTEEELYKLFNAFKAFGVVEFIRSGRVALARNTHGLSEHLPEAKWVYNI